ncbi:MAG: hypothetical protein HQL68_04455 [Magnetococcales bacterium]|nr:hypothetical protein [Magnetococcales bacterium]
MATPEALLFKIEGTQQISQIAGLKGKTYTVGKVSAAGKTGLSKWLFLHPTAAASNSSVALKIEGAQQISQLSGLTGKTVTVGQSPATVGGAGKWLLLNSGKGAAVASAGTTGAAAAKAKTASEMILVKAEGGRQAVDLTTLAGKSYTVMKPPIMGGTKATGWMFLKPTTGAGAAGEKIVAIKVQAGAGSTTVSSMAGKSFTVCKAPLAAGATGHQWLAFKPAAGLASKGAVATTVALKGNTLGAAQNSTIAVQTGTTGNLGSSLAGKSATATQAAKVAGSGTIWKGTGLSLGLGLGLGAWGPLLLVGVAAFGVGVYGYMKNSSDVEETPDEMVKLSLEG